MPPKKKPKKNKPKKDNFPTQPPSIPKIEKKNSIVKYLWRILLSISTVLGAILVFPDACEKVQECIESPKDKFTNEKYIQGIIIPYAIQRMYPTFIFINGNQTKYISLSKLKEGQAIIPGMVKCVNDSVTESPLPVTLQLIGERLYVSTTFYDVDRKYLGELRNEKWRVFKDQIADYSNGTRYLEVIDHYNNVVFSILYEKDNLIQIRGYFRGKVCSSVMSPPDETGMYVWQGNYPDYKDSILMYAPKIKRIGPSKFDNQGLN